MADEQPITDPNWGKPPVASVAPVTPDHTTFQEVADDLKQGGIGALKATGRTVANLTQIASWLMGTGQTTSPVIDALKAKIGQPEGTAQQVGAGIADVASAFIPGGEIEKGAQAASVMAKDAGPIGQAMMRFLARGAGSAGIAAAQGGDPIVGGLVGGTAGLASEGAAAALKKGAVNSMVRAMGPAGGRGPTDIEAAQEIAPTLVKRGFVGTSADNARSQAAQMVKQAGSDLQEVLGTEGANTFDQSKLLQDIQAKRDALAVPATTRDASSLPIRMKPVDDLYAELQQDVKNLGPNPSQEAIHDLKNRWNQVAFAAKSDPAQGSIRSVYQKGGDLIRAIDAKDAPAVSKADQAFHVAATLNTLTNAPNVLRPGAGVAAALSPYAKPVMGAGLGIAAGYKADGVPGAIVGGVTGAALGNLVVSPGFRYVSSAMKQMLANALDSGNPTRVAQVFSVVSQQAARLAKANQ